MEYYSIIAGGLTDLSTWTFESLKKNLCCPLRFVFEYPDVDRIYVVAHSNSCTDTYSHTHTHGHTPAAALPESVKAQTS